MFKISSLFDYKTTTGSIFLLALIAVFAYWQISFLQYALQWDMIDQYLPWRIFTGECYSNGIFPFWNPYQDFGYPIHADLRSVWYPEILLLGTLNLYSVYVLHFLIIFYAFLGAVGVKYFSKVFNCDSKTSFIAAVTYMLSGYYVSHLQEINGMVSFAFIPFLVYFYIKFIEKNTVKNILPVVFFLILNITGGYQAHTIIVQYLLAALFVFAMFNFLRKKECLKAAKFLILNVLLYTIIIAMSAMLIVSLMQSSDFVARFNGLLLQKAQEHPFSPLSFISFVLPFSTLKPHELFDNDATMRNAYFGVILLIFFVLALFKKKNSLQWLLLIFAILSLFIATGKYLPFHKIAYNVLPFFDKFRQPSFFIFFFLLVAIPTAANALISIDKQKNKLLFIASALFAFLVATLIFSYSKISFSEKIITEFSITNITNFIKSLNFYEHLFIQSILQIGILILFFSLLIKKHYQKKYLLVVIIFDLMLSVQLNIFYSGVNFYNQPQQIQQFINDCPKNYPVPSTDLNMATFVDQNIEKTPLWRNTNIFTKTTGISGFNPFMLDNYSKLFIENIKLAENQLNKPIAYFSEKIKPYSEISENVDSCAIYVNDSVFYGMSKFHTAISNNDSLFIKDFNPNYYKFQTETKSDCWFTLQQSPYVGWQVFIDKQQIKSFESNYLNISCLLPAGKHIVEFRYENFLIKTAFTIYIIILIALVILLLYFSIKKIQNRLIHKYLYIIIAIVFLLFIWKIYFNSDKLNNYKTDTYKLSTALKQLCEQYEDSILIAAVVNNPTFFDSVFNKEIKYFRFYNKVGLNKFSSYVFQATSPYFAFVEQNAIIPSEVFSIIQSKFPKKLTEQKFLNSKIYLFEKTKAEPPIFRSVLNFDSNNLLWNYYEEMGDTLENNSNKVYKMNNEKRYSPSITLCDTMWYETSNIQIEVTCKALSSTPKTDFIVIEHYSNNIMAGWYSVPVSVFANTQSCWETIFHTREFSPQKGDYFKIYFWHNSDSQTFIDDFSVSISNTEKLK